MATTPTAAGLTKGARITGVDRQALGAQLAERYEAGESIRALAQETGRSFGFVHGVIKESGVPLRARGGATRRSPAAAATPAAEIPTAQPTGEEQSPKPKAAKSKKKDEPKKSAAKKDEVKKEKTNGKKKGRS